MKNDFQLHRVLSLRSVNIAGVILNKERQPISTLRTRIQNISKKVKHDLPSDFMQVVLNGVPVISAPADQLEVFLPDGTRMVVTGEKSISLISSILKNR